MRFDIPGDPGFPRELNNLYSKPSISDASIMREYIAQLRTELGIRLLDKVYADDQSQPSKVSRAVLTFISDVIRNVFYHFSGGCASPNGSSSTRASPLRDLIRDFAFVSTSLKKAVYLWLLFHYAVVKLIHKFLISVSPKS